MGQVRHWLVKENTKFTTELPIRKFYIVLILNYFVCFYTIYSDGGYSQQMIFSPSRTGHKSLLQFFTFFYSFINARFKVIDDVTI